MKAKELMSFLIGLSPMEFPDTVDTCKAGDPEKELHKVAVSMFATPDVVRAAAAWGADLLIVHEPTYYSHQDIRMEDDVVTAKKRELLQQSGVTLYRYHDHAHAIVPDLVCEGELTTLGLHGTVERKEYGIHWITLDEPITPRELAKKMQNVLKIAHPRICGTMDAPITKISCCFGTPGSVFEELRNSEVELVMTGEACEWMLGEYARDADQLGMTKSLIIMGHIGSERDGMRLLARQIPEEFPELDARYFECGEVYSYVETPKKATEAE